MIKCDVILDPGEVNVYLVEAGYDPAHDFQQKMPEVAILERNDVVCALLGDNHEGIANVVLCWEATDPEGNKVIAKLNTSLALLENIVEAMRAKAGPDPRLTDEPG
jgi:hypothetical protein